MSVYLTRPYDPQYGGFDKNLPLLAFMVDRPMLFSAPTTPEERVAVMAAALTDPRHYISEVWKGDQFVGIVALTDIKPRVDATFHFVFLDRKLAGKRRLLLTWLMDAMNAEHPLYGPLGLQRVTASVPETTPSLVDFYRQRLGFRFEGEQVALEHPVRAALEAGVTGANGQKFGNMPKAEVWLARHGSRREHSHWVPPTPQHPHGRWVDVIVLRLLTTELAQRCEEVGICRKPSSEPLPPLSPEPSLAVS